MTSDDVREACDVLRPQWEASDGVDGRVSIEVDPRLAHEKEGAGNGYVGACVGGVVRGVSSTAVVSVAPLVTHAGDGRPKYGEQLADGGGHDLVLIAIERHPVTRPQDSRPPAHRQPHRDRCRGAPRHRQVGRQHMPPQVIQHRQRRDRITGRVLRVDQRDRLAHHAAQPRGDLRDQITRMPISCQPPQVARHDGIGRPEQLVVQPTISRGGRNSPVHTVVGRGGRRLVVEVARCQPILRRALLLVHRGRGRRDCRSVSFRRSPPRNASPTSGPPRLTANAPASIHAAASAIPTPPEGIT